MHPRRPEFPSPHSQPRWFAVWEALRTVPRLCDLGNISHPKMRWSDQEGPVFGSLVAASVREREVNGIVGQSALLSGSYCKPDPGSELTVKWNLYPDPTPLVKLIRTQCSPHPDKPGYNCSDRLIITPSHRGRVHLYPDNGSLLLCDLRSSDSGVYAISVYCGGNSSVEYNVSLMVHNGTGCGRKSDTTEKIAQSNGVSREELDENRDQNSHVDITYTLLQLPLPDCPTTTQGHENCIIYSAPRKNKDQNLHVDLMYSLLQLPLPDSPTTQGPETCIIYSAPRKVW
ncbi:uncharacterized protein LOC134346691 isoform X5 [Mobula hypostoma]|uniref:uncharacterized protein LOC134346691 isoform X5 n=1 Tax=Mobula hypostoma TaxID=723540 RepID=UPI002FC31FA2